MTGWKRKSLINHALKHQPIIKRRWSKRKLYILPTVGNKSCLCFWVREMVNTKISPKKAIVEVESAKDSYRITIQKQSENFLHFIFGETVPCVTPQTFCNYALGSYSDQGPPHFSSVLFRHDVEATTNSPCCMRDPEQLCHYHLLVYTRYTRRDTAVIRSAAHQLKKGPWLCSPIGNTRITRNIANKINIVKESNFYQIPVASPLTEYAALRICDSTDVLNRVGVVFRTLDNIIKVKGLDPILACKTRANWSTVEPVWAMHEPSRDPNTDPTSPNEGVLDTLPWYFYCYPMITIDLACESSKGIPTETKAPHDIYIFAVKVDLI